MKSLSLAFLLLLPMVSLADWTFDFSRRAKDLKDYQRSMPIATEKESSLFESIFEPAAPLQEIVIMNTDKGFVPATLRVRAGLRYRVHIVNINESEKNISFVMDSFSEHHSTYFGKIKTFVIQPKKQGVYSFQCPETSAQGRLVVVPRASASQARVPASRE